MSNNIIRQLRKAVRLKFRSTLPNISKFHNNTVRIWVPAKKTEKTFWYSERVEIARKLSQCIIESGIKYSEVTNENTVNDQICYFIIDQKDIESLIGWILIYNKKE